MTFDTSKPVTLFNASPTYKPFKYDWAYHAWKAQQKSHWLAEEVPLAEDITDWRDKLTSKERNLLTQIFRFFTQADVEVSDCYNRKYATVFQPTEIKMMLSAFSNMETIHMDAYSVLLETLGMPETEYQAFLNYKQMKDKYDYLQSFNVDSIRDIAKTLAAFGAFTEGVQLYASFVILLNFQRFNKMRGMGQIISLSVKDENLHCESLIMLFRTMIEENPRIWDDELKTDIYTIAETVIRLEDAFIDLAFEQGGVEGLEPEQVKQYIRYIADRRLLQLGMKNIFKVKTNPLPWADAAINGLGHVNFFENRATEYAKAAMTGTWDEAFTKVFGP